MCFVMAIIANYFTAFFVATLGILVTLISLSLTNNTLEETKLELYLHPAKIMMFILVF